MSLATMSIDLQLPPRQTHLVKVELASEEHEEITKMTEQGLAETVSDEVYVPYKCATPLNKSLPHPGDIVEASSLASLSLPPLTYHLLDAIPQEVISSGRLSDLQLEGISYACQQHQKILPNNTRAGFFIGDAAGVGKGRQIAGIVFDNYVRGRCKHLWFSVSADLKLDAGRDLEDIGCYIKVIGGCQQLDKGTKVFGLPSDLKEGVIFSTYATLVSSVQQVGGNKRSRLQQLVDWCGGSDFSGCLVFDECHRAKHYNPSNEKASTKVAVAVSTIQKMLPKARVVYCSATGVSHVKNMAFMERLGLWGEGTPFKSFEVFLGSITTRGLGASEMLAMEMKTTGAFVSRGLSFKHSEFGTVEVELTTEQEKLYNAAAHVWNELRKSLDHAQSRTNTASQSLNANFWSAHQRFFKQLCLSMKVPTIISETQKALKAGFAVVIGLQTTGEASMVHEMKHTGGSGSGSLSSWVSLTREILQRFISDFFPTEIKSPSSTLKDQWCVTAKKMLLDFTETLNFPPSPLDDIIDKLGGPSHVAEMTGRRGRIVRTARGLQFELRGSDSTTGVESLNIKEKIFFLNGTKFVAIISEAASTGVSLHADKRAVNQRRRVHLTFELPWSADKAVQQLGRTHRSNQSSAPVYKLVTTNLGGERRFASAVAQRLQSLGALTQGDRRAASAINLSDFNVDTPYGKAALKSVYDSVCRSQLCPGISLSSVTSNIPQAVNMTVSQLIKVLQECIHHMGLVSDSAVAPVIFERDTADVRKFLNRILGVQVLHQNLFFSYFCESLKTTIDIARREGRYNDGVTDLVASSVKLTKDPEIVFQEGRPAHQKTQHITVLVDRGVNFTSAAQILDQVQGKDGGFYWSRRESRGQRLHLLAIQKSNTPHLFKIIRPNTGHSPFEEDKDELMQKYVRISANDAAQGWNQQYNLTLDNCIHGQNCQSRGTCRAGCRTTEIHLLTGALIPLWSVLESTLHHHAESLHLTKNEQSLRVIRLQLDSGQRLIGVRYPMSLLYEVSLLMKELSAQQALLTNQEKVATAPTSEVCIEPESYVVPKLLSRATSVPVTIHKFFSSISSLKDTSSQGSREDHKNQIMTGSTTMSQKPEENNKHLIPVSTSVSCGGPGSVDRKRSRITDSNTVGQRMMTISQAFHRGAKRQATNCAVVDSCANKASSQKNALQCPVCQKALKQSASNTDLNRHVDDCLKQVSSVSARVNDL